MRTARDYLGLFAWLLVLQLPLIFNPGYLSHDELQWWARADVGWCELPWVSWRDFSVFQYRPLTFNLWLLLAHVIADTPVAMHFVFVTLGSLNALLLAGCVARAAGSGRPSAKAAMVFVVTPYVAYTHGWTGTLADLLVLTCTLLSVRSLQRADVHRSVAAPAAVCCLLITVALLCKESAVVIPALLLVALHRSARPNHVLRAVALSTAPVIVYLALRLRYILYSPHPGDAYAWSPLHVPLRLAEYFLYPFVSPLFEIAPTLSKSPLRLVAAIVCVLALTIALATRGRRWTGAWFALTVASLAPVLILAQSYNQYAYLASAATVGVFAAAWPGLRRNARIVVAVMAGIALAHGFAVMLRMREVGIAQQNFYADLLPHVRQSASTLKLTADNDSDRWMLQRFVAGVPSYRGVGIADRVVVIDPATTVADLTMRSDGRLEAPVSRNPPH